MINAQPDRAGRFRPLGYALGGLALLAGACLTARAIIGAPLILYNGSPSEPIGFYRLAHAPLEKGALVAFPVPFSGRAYAATALPYLTTTPILKSIGATYPETACANAGALLIDSRRAGVIKSTDALGRTLPHWTGCSRIGQGEIFAFSNRIPNSFDSRYYGPVPVRSVLGVYKPLWIFG